MKSSRPETHPLVCTRRTAVLGMLAPLIAGCTSDPNSDTSVLSSMVGQSLNIFSEGPPVPLEEVKAIPYASMGIRLGRSAQGIVILGSNDGNQLLWTSALHIAVQTRYGRIVTTAGLPHNLGATGFGGTDPLEEGAHRLHGGSQLTRYFDLSDKNIFQTPIHSRFTVDGPEKIAILGSPIKTIHVTENCVSRALDWEFANEYWADVYTGMIWRSRQNVHPDLDTIELEILRPPHA